MPLRILNTTVSLVKGDITQQSVDAIVNAANSSLMGGGGVDGAIHRAGGPKILEECMAHVEKHGRLPTGEAMITSGGRLKASRVIHTVGPVWEGGNSGEDVLLASAYRNSLRVAIEHGVGSIAFPCISTGIHGFPVERAVRIAFDTVKQFVREHDAAIEVRFVTFHDYDYRLYLEIFQSSQ